jgi:hypothetical protein
MSTGLSIQMMTDNCDVISMLEKVQNVTRCTDGDRLRCDCWQQILAQAEQCDQQQRQHFSGWFLEMSANSYCNMNEWINELARNPVRVTASHLTGTAKKTSQEELVIDRQMFHFLLRSPLDVTPWWLDLCLTCPLSANCLLEHLQTPCLSLPRFPFSIPGVPNCSHTGPFRLVSLCYILPISTWASSPTQLCISCWSFF